MKTVAFGGRLLIPPTRYVEYRTDDMDLTPILIVVLLLAVFGALAQAFGADSRVWNTDRDNRPWL